MTTPDRKTVDLWANRRRKTARKKRRSVRPAERSWRDVLPWREGQLGQLHTDPFEIEQFVIAMCGESWSKAGGLLKDAIATELAEGGACLRTFELPEEAPCRVEGSDRLSCRAAQIVRRTLRRACNLSNALPFTACIPKAPYGPPLAHGYVRMTRGIRMSSPARRSRSVPLEDWTPVPIVVGPSDAETTWSHLRERGAIAVWSERKLWLLRALRPFPTPFSLWNAQALAAGRAGSSEHDPEHRERGARDGSSTKDRA